jgi:hypothetical protein
MSIEIGNGYFGTPARLAAPHDKIVERRSKIQTCIGWRSAHPRRTGVKGRSGSTLRMLCRTSASCPPGLTLGHLCARSLADRFHGFIAIAMSCCRQAAFRPLRLSPSTLFRTERN